MSDSKPTVFVTGAAGNLALRLMPLLSDYEIIGIDSHPPDSKQLRQFVQVDLAKEESCLQLTSLIQEVKPVGIVHLAFIKESDVESADPDRMWHHNVAGTARVIEAITEANREVHIVEKFIHLSDVMVYGPNVEGPISEEHGLAAQGLASALHQMEADRVVQQRAPALRGCSVFMLRPQFLAGAGWHDYILEAFKGVPQGTSKRAERLRKKETRLPFPLPIGDHYLHNLKQFVHIDDLMRLIGYILGRTEPESQRLTILNVAGRGEALTMQQYATIAQAQFKRVPGKWGLQKLLDYRKASGISTIPREFAPHLTGQTLLNTDRLRKFLGTNYESVIRYPNAEAFADSFGRAPQNAQHATSR